MRRILAKILFCDEEDVNNVLMHMAVGASIAAVACLASGWLGLGLIYAFIKYERIEQKSIKDKCYPEVQGLLWGAILFGIILALVR
jgi:hypothetical protein